MGTNTHMPRGLLTYLFICFFLSVLLIPLLFTSVNEELFEFIKMLAVYVLTVLTLGGYVVLRITQKRWSWRRTPLDIPLLLFFIAQILATIFSMHPATSFYGYYTRFHGGLLSFMAYAALYYVFINVFADLPRSQAWRMLRWFLIALLTGGVLVGLYAIPEHFGHSVSCYLVQGSFDVACWVQDVKTRVFATLGQPNWLAAYMIMLIPLTSAWFLVGASTKKGSISLWTQLLLLGVTAIFYLTLLFTKSRSGLLGLACGLGLLGLGWLLVLWRTQRLKQSTSIQATPLKSSGVKSVTKMIILLAVFIGASLIYGTPYTPPFFKPQTVPQQEIKPVPTGGTVLENGGTESGNIRKIVWSGAVKVWQRHPLFGSGLETFAYSYYQDRPVEHNLVSEWNFLYNKAHNEFLNYLATAGILGFVTYCTLLVSGLFLGLRLFWHRTFHPEILKSKAITADQPEKLELFLHSPLFPLSLVAGIVALSISNFFGFSTVLVTMLMYYFLAIVSMLTIFEKNHSDHKKQNTPRALNWWQYAAISLVICVSIILIWMTINWWVADLTYAKAKSQLHANDWQKGLSALVAATAKSPQEPLYTDTLSEEYAGLAVRLVEINEATAAAEFVQAALTASDVTLRLNPVHLNFYKTRVRVLTQLAQIDQSYLEQAKETLIAAEKLAPTDPSLLLNQARIAVFEKKYPEAKKLYEAAIQLKSNFADARNDLAMLYESEGDLQSAYQQYNYILTNISPDNVELQQKVAYLATVSAKMQKQSN